MSPEFSPLLYNLIWDGSQDVPELPPAEVSEISPEVKKAVRDLLRFGGYKPSGRGRPASESLVKAVEDGRFPAIHPVVDFFNVVSLQSGFPISVLDADKLEGETGFRLGETDESYIFNPSGQELKVEGLPVLFDQVGPTGSPVKDAQRTKVDSSTTRFFVVVWGTNELPEQLEQVRRRVDAWTSRCQLA
ncbi:MAG: hypothetical protein KC800_26915 [Candidatus Eremiobacteraeota bacterium]|nr:hypothetical protein [Candidatus Eremiobacteraeota bacterium]